MATLESFKNALRGIKSNRTLDDRDLKAAVLLTESATDLDLSEFRECVGIGSWESYVARQKVEIPTLNDFRHVDITTQYDADVVVGAAYNGDTYTATILKNRYGEYGVSVEFFVHEGRYVDFAEARRLLRSQKVDE